MTTPTEKLQELETLWQGLVARELKTDKPSLTKGLGLGLKAPILSTTSSPQRCPQFAVAPLSVTLTRGEDFSWQTLREHYQAGVYDFILDPFLLGWSRSQCQAFVSEHQEAARSFEGRLWGLGELQGLGPLVLHAQELTRWGGHGVHELGLLLHRFIQWAQEPARTSEVALALEMETDFFKAIAKKRALSLMLESVAQTLGQKNLLASVKIIARAPWRSFTAFDHHSNILRNATALSAAYLSGCDVVESLPFDLLVNLPESERTQARRLGLTSQLVLQNESHLSEITDPAHGSYTIENLTQIYLKEAWSFMQSLQQKELTDLELQELAQGHWREVTQNFNKRRLVQAGVNDFALAQAQVELHPRWKLNDHVRLARGFEELRLSVKTKTAVHMAVVGSYASLQARANFTKNYFELLGLEVVEQIFSTPTEAREWLKQSKLGAWVTSDQLHGECFQICERTYLAGKTEVAGCVNIFAGQDVFGELSALASWLQGRA